MVNKESNTQDFEDSQALDSSDGHLVAPTRTIQHASDAEVDRAMEYVFKRHDRLLAELAK